MEIVYSYYEANKKFEEKQAYIYNQAIKEYRGEEVTAKAIEERNTYDGPEPYGIKYASTSDGSALAYIQYRAYHYTHFISLWIGYPWCIKHCPIEIPQQLFNEMLVYIKSKYPYYPINLGYFDNRFTKMHEFAKIHGFIEKYQKIHYLFDVKKLREINYYDLPLKVALADDIAQLVDLAERDKIIDKVYLNGKDIKEYLEQDHLKQPSSQNKLSIVYDGDQYIAAGVIQVQKLANQFNLSFTMCKPGHEQILRTLLAKLSHSIEDDRPLQVIARNDQDYWHTFAKELQAEIIKKRTLYVLH